MTRPVAAILGLVFFGSLVLLEGTARASHPGTTSISVSPTPLNVTVATDGTVTGLAPVVVTVNHTDRAYTCVKITMVHVMVEGAQAPFDARAPGANGSALCNFDNSAMTFTANLWGPDEMRRACVGLAGFQRTIQRTVQAYLDYSVINIGQQTDVSASASNPFLVHISCLPPPPTQAPPVVESPKATATPAQLNPKNLPTLSSTTPVSAAFKNGTSPALDAQTLGRWMPPHTAAKNDVDAAYAALAGSAGNATPAASFAKYAAATLAYQAQYGVCVNASITPASGTAAGCLPADSWGQCTDKIMAKCMATAAASLTSARTAVRQDAGALAIAAQRLADAM